jgi:hypothetical protein
LINYYLSRKLLILLVLSVWTKHEPRGIRPSPRALSSLTAVGRKLYLFGGALCTDADSDDTSGFCDLYELDIGKVFHHNT